MVEERFVGASYEDVVETGVGVVQLEHREIDTDHMIWLGMDSPQLVRVVGIRIADRAQNINSLRHAVDQSVIN